MPEPLRSPKQSRVAAKHRTHPYSRPANQPRARDAGVPRSNSLLGTIKSFVTAPLAWLSLSDSPDPIESSQKRRVSGSERGGTPPRAKRARRDSPGGAGYLDPPESLFETNRTTTPLWSHANGVVPTRTMSMEPPPPSVEPSDVALPPSRGHSMLSRTSMSVEPQDSYVIRRSNTRDLSMPPPSPFARSFSRSSLTPQPAGATFGPSPKRRPRESTAPPLLGSSTPTPSFTRPPPSNAGQQNLFPRAPSRGMSEGPISALLGHSRQSVSPLRESPTRSMLIRDEVHMSRSPNKNIAERTLSTLESFRTPLHISRFPSAPLAEEHRPRKVHVPMASKLRFDHTPEGRKEKAKRAPAIVGPYSSGMSGMRKLLARRREEAERDAEVEVESEPEDVPSRSLSEEAEIEHDKHEKRDDKGKVKQDDVETDDSRGSRKLRPHANGTTAKADAPLPRMRSPSRSKPDGPYSTLRAPSSRVSRTHAPAPRLKKARNKFSLDDDDEEQEWGLSIEDVKSFQAQAKLHPPISFGSQRSMSDAGMQTDLDSASLSRATSPPALPAQPQTFDSLLSRIGSPVSMPAKPATVFPAAAEQPKSDTGSQAKSPTLTDMSSAPATLPFSFGSSTTASPTPVEAAASPFAPNTTAPVPSPTLPVSTSGPGSVPSFFANTKAQFTPPKVPLGSLFGGPPTVGEKKEATATPKNAFGGFGETVKEEKQNENQAQKESKPPPFGGVNQPSLFGSSSTPASSSGSLFGNSAPSAPTNSASPFGGFGSTPAAGSEAAPKSAFAFGTPAPNDVDVSKPGISVFGATSKDSGSPLPTTDPTPKSTFAFGAPPQTSTPSAEKPDPTPAAPPSDVSPKPPFAFGAPAPAPTSSTEAPKSLFSFGTSASTQSKPLTPNTTNSPFSFGAAPSTPPPADKKPAFAFGITSGASSSGFSFGSGTPSNGAVNGNTIDAPKSLFGGFEGLTAPTTTTGAPKTPEATPADGGDGMEMSGDRMEESPTRTVDKKDVLTPQLPQSSPFGGFAGGSSSTGFSFVQDKPPASTGGFAFGQPKPSTSTGFGFGQTADKSTTGPNASTAFGFGSDASKPTGQSQSPFGAPLSTPFGGAASNPATSSNFSFGQSSTSTNASPFGQPQQAENGRTTTPSSPSLFSQPQPQPQSPSFPFNTTSAGNAFSSNAGPATPSSPTIQPFQFGAPGSTPQQQQPQQPGAAAGNNMFTLGGAATPPRRVKGLPTRRGTKRP